MNDLQLGKAGEYLVCFDLIMKGYIAYPSEQGLPYDIVLDNGGKLYKVQVKSTREPLKVPQRKKITRKYLFHIKRCGKNGNKQYNDIDVDIFALVGIDKKVIGYIKKEDVKKTMFFLPEGEKPVTSIDEVKEQIKKMYRDGKTLKEIKNTTGKDKSYIIRVKDGKQNKSFARNYLSNHEIEKCL